MTAAATGSSSEETGPSPPPPGGVPGLLGGVLGGLGAGPCGPRGPAAEGAGWATGWATGWVTGWAGVAPGWATGAAGWPSARSVASGAGRRDRAPGASGRSCAPVRTRCWAASTGFSAPRSGSTSTRVVVTTSAATKEPAPTSRPA